MRESCECCITGHIADSASAESLLPVKRLACAMIGADVDRSVDRERK